MCYKFVKPISLCLSLLPLSLPSCLVAFVFIFIELQTHVLALTNHSYVDVCVCVSMLTLCGYDFYNMFIRQMCHSHSRTPSYPYRFCFICSAYLPAPEQPLNRILCHKRLLLMAFLLVCHRCSFVSFFLFSSLCFSQFAALSRDASRIKVPSKKLY